MQSQYVCSVIYQCKYIFVLYFFFVFMGSFLAFPIQRDNKPQGTNNMTRSMVWDHTESRGPVPGGWELVLNIAQNGW